MGHQRQLCFRFVPCVSFWDSGSPGHALLLADSGKVKGDRSNHICTSTYATCIGQSKSQEQAQHQWGEKYTLPSAKMHGKRYEKTTGNRPITVIYTMLSAKLLIVCQYLKTDSFPIKIKISCFSYKQTKYAQQ